MIKQMIVKKGWCLSLDIACSLLETRPPIQILPLQLSLRSVSKLYVTELYRALSVLSIR